MVHVGGNSWWVLWLWLASHWAHQQLEQQKLPLGGQILHTKSTGPISNILVNSQLKKGQGPTELDYLIR